MSQVANSKKQKKILVVEDERSLADVVSAKLSKVGYDVGRAVSVSEAEKALKTETYDAVWLDHYLLGMKDGFDLVAIMKENPLLSKIPVFLVSNSSSDDKIRSYLKLGVDKYFVKSDHSLETIINDISSTIGEPIEDGEPD